MLNFNETLQHSDYFYYDFQLNEHYFEVLYSTANQSYHHVRARNIGTTSVAALFTGLMQACFLPLKKQ